MRVEFYQKISVYITHFMHFEHTALNELRIHIENHMIDEWDKIIDTLHNDIIQSINNNNLDYGFQHIKTVPIGDPMYELAIPKPKYWTFAFIVLKKNPSNVYYLWSDHNDGVFVRHNNANCGYTIEHTTPCIRGVNSINQQEEIFCVIECSNIQYVNVPWYCGVKKQEENVIETNFLNKKLSLSAKKNAKRRAKKKLHKLEHVTAINASENDLKNIVTIKDVDAKKFSSVIQFENEIVKEWLETDDTKCYYVGDDDNIFSFVLIHGIDYDPYGKYDNPYVIDYVFTFPNYRRKGYAMQLLSYLKSLFQVTAFCENLESEKLFKKANYSHCGLDTVFKKLAVYRCP